MIIDIEKDEEFPPTSYKRAKYSDDSEIAYESYTFHCDWQYVIERQSNQYIAYLKKEFRKLFLPSVKDDVSIEYDVGHVKEQPIHICRRFDKYKHFFTYIEVTQKRFSLTLFNGAVVNLNVFKNDEDKDLVEVAKVKSKEEAIVLFRWLNDHIMFAELNIVWLLAQARGLERNKPQLPKDILKTIKEMLY